MEVEEVWTYSDGKRLDGTAVGFIQCNDCDELLEMPIAKSGKHSYFNYSHKVVPHIIKHLKAKWILENKPAVSFLIRKI